MAHAQLSRAGTGFSATPSTPNTSSSADRKEFDTVWKDLKEQVIKLAGGDQTRIRKLEIEDVLATLDAISKEKAEKEANDKYRRLKDVTLTTLQCIQTVGGMIAEGASEAFGPSQMCFNALTFVLQSWSNYLGIFENLAELLEKCAEFLERLTYYKDKMDTRLACLACQNLRLFVEICSRVISLRKKHARLFAFTKQLFLNDNGIQDVLDMMDRLNSKETLLVNAQTWRIVQDSSGKLNILLEGQRKQRRDEEMKDWRRTIVARLGFPETSLGSNKEPIPYWRKAYENRKNSLVDGTGTWMVEHPRFVDWLASDDPSHYMLVLQGDSNSGKTSLLANVLRHILTMDQPGPTSRAVCAYYFPQADRRKEDDEDTGTLLEVISRTLLWQIATAYEAITKSFTLVLDRRSDFINVKDQWAQLFTNNKERLNPDTTFYLFIDAVDEDAGSLLPLLQSLSSVSDNKKVRILLTARPKTIREHLGRSAGLDFATIPIQDFNKDDVEKFINHRMDNMAITRDPDRRPGIQTWRDTILESLKRDCHGDFIKLGNSLKELSFVDLVEDITAILIGAGRTKDDLIGTELRRLNNSRTHKEIEEINEIICWIEEGRRWFSVDEMEALLSIKYRHARHGSGSSPASSVGRFLNSPKAHAQSPKLAPMGFGNALGLASAVDNASRSSSPISSTQSRFGISLLPFAQTLDKYSIFTVTDSGNVDWKSIEYVPLIPVYDDYGFSSNLIAQQGHVLDAEIAIMKHVLRGACPPELYARFGFEKFFDVKASGGGREGIHIDRHNAHLRITITCLTILTDPGLKLNVELRYYAIWWLLGHMQATDLSMASRELKASAGSLLVKLFTEDCGIDTFFWPFDLNISMETWRHGEGLVLRDGRSEWLYTLGGVEEIRRWIRDSCVVGTITTSIGENFVANVRNAAPSDLHKVVLAPAARRIAKRLYHQREGFTKREIVTGHWFLRGYLSRCDERAQKMTNSRHDYVMEESDLFSAFENETFNLEDVLEIEAWCLKTLHGDSNDTKQKSLWETHAALAIFQLTEGNAALYQERSRNATRWDSQNFHAAHFVASFDETPNEEAISLLKRAKKDMDYVRSRNPSFLEDRATSSLLARITLELGNRLWESGEDAAIAAKAHRESLRFDYVHFRDYVTILESYQERAAWHEIISFVVDLCNTKALWEAWYDELVNEFMLALSRPGTNFLARAADETERWDVVDVLFSVSSDVGAKRDATNLYFNVQDAWAKTLEAASGDRYKSEILNIRRDALASVKQHPDTFLPKESVSAMTDSLAQAYLELALAQDTTTADAEKYGNYLADLAPQPDHHYDIWSVMIPVCSLIRYHTKRRTPTKLSAYWLHRVIRASLELLSDDDQENDDIAYWILSRILTTVGDRENTRIVYNLRNSLQAQASRAWEQWKLARDMWQGSELPSQAHTEPTPYSSRESSFSGEDSLNSHSLQRHRTWTDLPSDAHTNATRGLADRRRQFQFRTNTSSPTSSSATNTPVPLSRRTSAPVRGILHVNTGSSMPPVPGTPDNDSSVHTGPTKPDWFVDCAACNKRWVVGDDEVLHTCADCCGVTKLCETCYAAHKSGGLPKTKTMRCDPAHEMFAIPKWIPSIYIGMPKGCVPLPDITGGAGEERWITTDLWKSRLRKKYLSDDRRSYVLASPTTPVLTR